MTIENISKNRLGRYSLLHTKKHREAEGLFVVEGEKCVRELAAMFAPEALIATPQWLASQQAAETIRLFSNVYSATSRDMNRLSSLSSSPPVISVMHKPAAKPLPRRLPHGLYLALDGVRDPGNMGTIIRTADWFGIKTIFASTDTVDVFNSKTIQSTMGSLGRVDVIYTSLPDLFADNADMPVYGTLLDGEDIYTANAESCGFIVMGNEGAGLSQPVRRCVNRRLLIPSFAEDENHAESLNVAIATGIVLSEFRRRTKTLK